ncbi:MAG: pyrroline-5-carboxylate reductase [Bacteroidota bacterium]
MGTYQKATIIGAGNLGLAIAKGLVKANKFEASQITLTRRSTASIDYLSKDGFALSTNNSKAVAESDIIFLCVQPKQIEGVINEIREALNSEKTVVSVATGVKTPELTKLLSKEVTVIRAMPNTAIAVNQSMTCICGADGTSENHLEEVKNLFDSVGKTLVINEELMQAATVLGASGIAFFLRYIRAATQGGIQMGFDSDEANFIAVQTAIGASSLIQAFENHPESEIDRVTTPRGCTIEGLNEMEHQGLSSAVIKGIMASFHKINDIR